MQNLFFAPRSNEKSRENFLATLENGYPIADVAPYLSSAEKTVLGSRRKLYVWGNTAGKKHSWEKMQLGDYVAFYAKGEFVYVGICILKKHSPEIARQLWGNVPKREETWEYVYFLDSIRPIKIPLDVFIGLGNYKENMVVQGFMPIKPEGLRNIISNYGSLSAFFDSFSPGLKSRDVSILEQISEKERLTGSEIEEIDAITRGKELNELLLEWEQRRSGEEPEVIERKARTIKRNVSVVRQMKEKYRNECQICGFTFKQRNGSGYSEVAHIKPISARERGSDAPSNMVVLCPNHHKMLDLGNLKITSATGYSLDGEVKKLREPLFNANS